MKLLSGAVLFLVLIGSNLQAFDQAGKNKDKDKDKDQPESSAISGFRDVAGERESKRSLWLCPIPSWRKSTCAF